MHSHFEVHGGGRARVYSINLRHFRVVQAVLKGLSAYVLRIEDALTSGNAADVREAEAQMLAVVRQRTDSVVVEFVREYELDEAH